MKQLVIILGFIIFFAFTQNISTQQWSAEQQEVWKTINAQWQADKDGKNWVDEFVHPDCFGWNNSTPMPSNKSNTTRWFKAYQSISKTLEYQITPTAIIVKDNFAIAHYYYVILNENYDKKIEREIGRWTDILIKEGDKWLFIAWQGGADKSKD
jgi:hypothetical protein